MSEEANSNQSSRQSLTGYVIITLPPPDNPSKGKTITAYTISHDQPNNNNNDNNNSPAQTPQTQPLPIITTQPQQQQQRRLGLFSFRPQLTLLPLICISVICVFVWASVNSDTRFELREPVGSNEENGRRENETERERTFVFPLYNKGFTHNVSVLEEGEVKLGRFLGLEERRRKRVGDDDDVGRVVSVSLSDAGVLPVRGNVYPDGYAFYVYSFT